MMPNMGELTAAQMGGPVLLPWPIPAISVSHVWWLVGGLVQVPINSLDMGMHSMDHFIML